MNTWLKGLIAVACGVVILIGAHYAWVVWQSYKNDAAYKARLGDLRAELFAMAGAEPSDASKVQRFCISVRDSNLYTSNAEKSHQNQIVQACRSLNYL